MRACLRLSPGEVRSILFEEILGGVTVAWTLGELTRARDVDCIGYGVDYTGPHGYGGKRFGVRFDPEASAYVFDWSSATDAITCEDASILG